MSTLVPPMVRKSDNTTAISSSIVLLQERFRKLQKVKAMREERELLRWFEESERITPATMHHDTSRLFFHSEVVLHHGPLQRGSLSHQANSRVNNANFQAVETPLLYIWPRDKANIHTSNSSDNTDVDTSLHL